MGALARWLCEEAYEDMKLWIYDITHKFRKQYGGNFLDLLAEANYLFVYHLENYDPGRTALTTYLSQKIWYGLIDAHKTGWRRWNKHPSVSIDLVSMDHYCYKPSTFLTDLMDGLTDDARTVVEKILNPDLSLARYLMYRDGFRVERRALTAYFTQKYKWEEDRVIDAFWAIQRALA